MLSRLAFRSLREAKPFIVAIRPTSTAVVNKDAEADQVQFPRRVRAAQPDKVRLGFIPEEWFQALYPKTGVTGPYMLGLGLAMFMFSKEIFVMEHEFMNGLTILYLWIIVAKKYGPSIGEYADKEIALEEEKMKNYRVTSMNDIKEEIELEKKYQLEAQAYNMVYQARRENVALQLEAAYRERLATAHSEVKKRLDYQLETANVKTRIEQKHMVDWIVDNVKSSITPVQEAAALKQCFADLKAMAPKGA